MNELQQGGLTFKDHKVIGKLEHRLDPPEVVHQPSEDAPADGQMQIRVRLLKQAAEGQARHDLGRRGDRDADQVGSLRQNVRHQSGPEDLQVRILLLVRDRLQDVLGRSEEHTSELQSRLHLVCRLLLEKKKKKK